MTTGEIRDKFERDDVVERYTNLATGQIAIVDAAVNLEVLTETAKRIVPRARNVLDIGCGAGNYTLKLLSSLPNLNCTLVDLSGKMIKKALERITPVTSGKVLWYQKDIREIELPKNRFDIAMAGAVLHHLRGEEEWNDVFSKVYDSIAPGGCFLISDLITHANQAVEECMWERYEEYIGRIGGPETFSDIEEGIAREDTPRTIAYQLDLLSKVGFKDVDVLHKNILFATFGGVKKG